MPRGRLFGVLPFDDDRVMYVVVLAAFAAVWLFIARVVDSPFGQVLAPVRDNERRAVSPGHDAHRHEWIAFVKPNASSTTASARPSGARREVRCARR